MSLQKESEKDHKCGGELCIVCGYREKIKKSDWEREFDENFEWFIKLGESQLETSDTPNIKAFIQETLSNREKEIAEEVEKTYGKDGGPALVIIESHEGGVTQRPALNEVLQILKH